MATLPTRIFQTLIDLAGIPSTSGHEEQVRAYIKRRLDELGLTSQVDDAGNLIASLPGQGKPLLLNAHMDRVPPGLAHVPVLRSNTLYSDGTTNLGADDACGIALILELLARLLERHLPHPALVLVFTVEEETGLRGARAFDPTPWDVHEGFVFDNAFEAGVVVSQGATYVAFDIAINGRTGHPGKDLSSTINAFEILRTARYPHGSLNQDQTRILLGRISAGTARNAVPASVHIEGELRSFEPPEARQAYLQELEQAFQDAARELGGSIHMTFEAHCTSYRVQEDEPLLQLYRSVLTSQGETLRLQRSFVGSDTSAFRPRVQTLTISTGVVNEHSFEEYVPLEPLGIIVENILQVLQLACSPTP
jgi:tripeptide aminopeptidase